MYLGIFFSQEMNRAKSVSVSEEEPEQHQQLDCKKKHRRGKKRTRPKWKPYSKMTFEERKQLEEWEANHVIMREAKINACSKRPVAPFNSTQFLMDDRSETQLKSSPLQLVRTMSYDSSSSGDDVHYEPSDEDLQEQEAFLEADFNQVYNQLKMNRLEGMSKQDLVSQCYNLEDKVSSVEQEKLELLAELHQLRQTNGELVIENSRLKQSNFSTTTSTSQ